MKMELWIRSQSKEKLVKVNEIKYEEYKNVLMDYPIAAIIINDKIVQEYKSKERALEVLDEIQNKINLINLGHDFGSPMIDLKNPTYIYQMPKE